MTNDDRRSPHNRSPKPFARTREQVAKSRNQNWFFWIAADVVYIPLYFVKVLYLTGIVYVVFLGLCLLGLRAWQRELRALPDLPDLSLAAAPAAAS